LFSFAVPISVAVCLINRCKADYPPGCLAAGGLSALLRMLALARHGFTSAMFRPRHELAMNKPIICGHTMRHTGKI
jgi:hypothetical protein